MRLPLILSLALFAATPAAAIEADAIDTATWDSGALPQGQTPLTARVQILLDRAGISPGIIDGYAGGMTDTAVAAFEAREGFEVDGRMDAQVWQALGGAETGPVMRTYTIAASDLDGLVDAIPDHIRDLAEMERLAHTSVAERLAERFHMDIEFLRQLNPDAAFTEGETLAVVDTGADLDGDVARIEVRKDTSRLVAFDADGAVLANYPVTVGSASTPSPSGTVEVVAVARMPNYTYNPSENFVSDGVEETLILPPGPNNPVGTIWIDLSEPTYGIHGTPDPAELFTNQSHGCVRMTNWDAEELAGMVAEGVVVEFVE